MKTENSHLTNAHIQTLMQSNGRGLIMSLPSPITAVVMAVYSVFTDGHNNRDLFR